MCSSDLAREPSKPTLKKVGMTFICKPCPRGNPKDVSENRRLFVKPKEPHHKGTPVAHHPRFHNNTKLPHMGHPGSNPQAKSLRCFRCGGIGHWANTCEENSKDQVWAAHTEKPDDTQNDVEGQADDDKSSADGSHASHDADLADDKEYVEMDVYEQNSSYERETEMEFMAPMFDVGDHCHDTMATLTNGGTITREIKLRKAHVRTSKTAWQCPEISQEDKECLATFISMGGFKAWTLWDSGSTTTGITPTFAQVAKIMVFPLSNPHMLQLGMVGSRSTVNFGTETLVTAPGVNSTIYMDIVNFDHYDMIIGTLFM